MGRGSGSKEPKTRRVDLVFDLQDEAQKALITEITETARKYKRPLAEHILLCVRHGRGKAEQRAKVRHGRESEWAKEAWEDDEPEASNESAAADGGDDKDSETGATESGKDSGTAAAGSAAEGAKSPAGPTVRAARGWAEAEMPQDLKCRGCQQVQAKGKVAFRHEETGEVRCSECVPKAAA